jgi:hypothetical protein
VNSRRKSKETVNRDEMKSLYILECNGLYKVGISFNVRKRKQGIQTSNPYKIKNKVIYHKIPLTTKIEFQSMKKLNDHRMNGEWFNCDIELIEKAIEETLRENKINSFEKLRYNEDLQMYEKEWKRYE